MSTTRTIPTSAAVLGPRALERSAFDAAYAAVVLGNDFFEEPAYYHRQRDRYRRTLEYVAGLPLPRPARILEIGGGQIILLCRELFGDQGVLADVSDAHAAAVTRFGLEFVACDLLHDDLPYRGEFDLVVLCEVIEHLPVPPHAVLEKVATWMRPGGRMLVTTPNLYRLRNVVRLALGMPLFCEFFVPRRGQSIGHPLEYSERHLRWQLAQAGLDVEWSDLVQLSNSGASVPARLARLAMRPLLTLPRWRDNLVACAVKPDGSGIDDHGSGRRAPRRSDPDR